MNTPRAGLRSSPACLTELWQVSGRADLPGEESLRLDMRYVEHWSFALDLQILDDSAGGHPWHRCVLTRGHPVPPPGSG